jgi:hypothetical protein
MLNFQAFYDAELTLLRSGSCLTKKAGSGMMDERELSGLHTRIIETHGLLDSGSFGQSGVVVRVWGGSISRL